MLPDMIPRTELCFSVALSRVGGGTSVIIENGTRKSLVVLSMFHIRADRCRYIRCARSTTTQSLETAVSFCSFARLAVWCGRVPTPSEEDLISATNSGAVVERTAQLALF